MIYCDAGGHIHPTNAIQNRSLSIHGSGGLFKIGAVDSETGMMISKLISCRNLGNYVAHMETEGIKLAADLGIFLYPHRRYLRIASDNLSCIDKFPSRYKGKTIKLTYVKGKQNPAHVICQRKGYIGERKTFWSVYRRVLHCEWGIETSYRMWAILLKGTSTWPRWAEYVFDDVPSHNRQRSNNQTQKLKITSEKTC